MGDSLLDLAKRCVHAAVQPQSVSMRHFHCAPPSLRCLQNVSARAQEWAAVTRISAESVNIRQHYDIAACAATRTCQQMPHQSRQAPAARRCTGAVVGRRTRPAWGPCSHGHAGHQPWDIPASCKQHVCSMSWLWKGILPRQ